MRRRLTCSGVLCLVILWCSSGAWAESANPMRAPAERLRPQRPQASSAPVSVPTQVFDTYVRFFQRVISPVDGARSNMYPTGSDYARRVFKKHGALLGFVLTAERLMHEVSEGAVSPRIRKYGIWRVHDPVAANDWWWHDPHWVYHSNWGRPQQR